MIIVAILVCIATAHGGVVHKRALQTMDDFSLQTFVRIFRETLLDKVALEMNNTVDMTKQLKIKVDQCMPKINARTNECKSCTQSTCQKSPDLMDYLKILNPYTYLKKPLNDMAGKISDAVDLLGDGASEFLNSMKDLGVSATGELFDGFSSAFEAFKKGLGQVSSAIMDAGNSILDTAHLIGDGFTDIGNTLSGGLTDAGHAIENLGNSIGHIGSDLGHSIGHILGKKREISPEIRGCMERCDSCRPLLMPLSDTITAVCGGEIVEMNNTIQARVEKIQKVYDAALDITHPIISKLEFDPTSMNGQMELSNVHVTVMLNGHLTSYKTQVPYSMMKMPETARNMAMEYWGKS